MERAKAWFVSTTPFLNLGISLYAFWMIHQGADLLLWLGVALAGLPFALLMSKTMIASGARTSANLPYVVLPALIGASLSLSRLPAHWDLIALIATVLAIGVTLLYVFWYSRLAREHSEKLEVGAILPVFELEEVSGEQVLSSDFRGEKALFIFYRGNWCPLCMAQVKEIAGQYRALDERGVKVALVSPQAHENTKDLADRFDVPFRFLVDRSSRAARALDIVHEGGVPAGIDLLGGYELDTVYPTVILVDERGKVLFADQTDNYRVRPEPETFLRILDGEQGIESEVPALSMA